MTGNINLFDHFTSYDNYDIVLIGNGKHLSIEHIADIILRTASGPLV